MEFKGNFKEFYGEIKGILRKRPWNLLRELDERNFQDFKRVFKGTLLHQGQV